MYELYIFIPLYIVTFHRWYKMKHSCLVLYFYYGSLYFPLFIPLVIIMISVQIFFISFHAYLNFIGYLKCIPKKYSNELLYLMKK